MCLHTKATKILIAKEDIICYKQLYSISVDTALSQYRQHEYRIHELQPTVPLKFVLSTNNFEHITGNTYSVNEGYHSYIDKPSIRLYGECWICIIPKGTKYAIGKFATDRSYVSESIIWTGERCIVPEVATRWQKLKNYFTNIFN